MARYAKCTISSGTLNVRNAASTTGTSIGTIKPNDVVEVISTTGDWYYVRARATNSSGSAVTVTGYVCRYLNGTTYMSNVIDNTGSAGTVTATSGTVNVRSGPATTHLVYYSLAIGTAITVHEPFNGWYIISHSNGIGCISSDYVKIGGGSGGGSTGISQQYNRDGAIQYAKLWCNGHNPAFPDYDNDNNSNTSDCANYVSQCLREGGKVPEKFTTNSGSYDYWYYRSASDRTPSWTGAQSLRLFFKYNTIGYPRLPATFLGNTEISDLQKGDLVFSLNNDGDSKNNRTAKHVAIVSRVSGSTIYVYAHSVAKNDEAWGSAANDTLFCKLDDYIQLS